MKRILPLLAALLLASCATLNPKEPPGMQKISQNTLAVGSVEIFPLPHNGRLIVGKPDLIRPDIDPMTGEVRLTALKKGITTVLIQDEKGKVVSIKDYQIITNDLMQRAIHVKEMLGQGTGLQVQIIDEFVVITGSVKDLGLIDRTVRIENAYQGQVVSLVTVDNELYEERARKMEEEIHRAGMKAVKVRWVGHTYFIEGQADSVLEREKAEVIVQTLLPPIMNSPAIAQGVLLTGAKMYSIRNFVTTPSLQGLRLPASGRELVEPRPPVDALPVVHPIPAQPAYPAAH